MAYVNLVNEVLDNAGTDAGEAEAFMRFRDFVCKRNGTYDYSATGIGWTLHDSSYAVDEDNAQINDWFVIHSTGETGRDKMYFKVILIADHIQINGWQYWNNSTHAGEGTSYFRDNAWFIQNPVALYIYGDLDFIHPIIAGIAGTTNWSHGNFGCLDDSWLVPLEGMGIPRNVQVCSSALSAGSDVSIVVPDSSSKLWAPDCHLFIMDDASIERILVKANNGSTTLTADLTNSYSAGARIAVVFPYYVPQRYSYDWPGRTGPYNATLHDLSGNLGPTNMTRTSVLDSSSFNMLDGNGYWGNLQVAGPKFICRSATGDGPLGHIPNCYEMYDTTGLTHEDLLDDVTDPAVKWRYCATHTPRVYKEV